jgi:hypothetical protein
MRYNKDMTNATTRSPQAPNRASADSLDDALEGWTVVADSTSGAKANRRRQLVLSTGSLSTGARLRLTAKGDPYPHQRSAKSEVWMPVRGWIEVHSNLGEATGMELERTVEVDLEYALLLVLRVATHLLSLG